MVVTSRSCGVMVDTPRSCGVMADTSQLCGVTANALWSCGVVVVTLQPCGVAVVVSPLGHGVASIPIRVLYSHAGLVGTAEDLSSQTTKSSDHMKGQMIRITCKVT